MKWGYLIYIGKTNIPNSTQSYQATQEETFDFALLYYLKYSVSFIYDMYLTLSVFNSIKLNKINKNTVRFDLKTLSTNVTNNLMMLQKLKNFKISIAPEKNEATMLLSSNSAR